MTAGGLEGSAGLVGMLSWQTIAVTVEWAGRCKAGLVFKQSRLGTSWRLTVF